MMMEMKNDNTLRNYNQRLMSRYHNNNQKRLSILLWMISLVWQIVVVVVISNIRPVSSLQRIQTFGRHYHQCYHNNQWVQKSTASITGSKPFRLPQILLNHPCYRWRRYTTSTTTGLSFSEKNRSDNNNPIIMDDTDSDNNNNSNNDSTIPPQRIMGHNKSMEFLRKIGKVGGAANRDFRFAVGVDEGPSGKSYSNNNNMKKVSNAYQSCVLSGVVDDMTETFPTTSSGAKWDGFTDRVMGGVSIGNLSREMFAGRTANVLRGKVSLANNGGFIQMATNLVNGSGGSGSSTSFGSSTTSVDASKFSGIEVDVHNGHDSELGYDQFNLHVKTADCIRPFSSYRASFDARNGVWETIRIPFTQLIGKGPGAIDVPFDQTKLTRVGILAIGQEMNVKLALSGIRFY